MYKFSKECVIPYSLSVEILTFEHFLHIKYSWLPAMGFPISENLYCGSPEAVNLIVRELGEGRED